MAGISTLSPKSTLSTVREEFRYTAARLSKHRLTATILAPVFLAFRTRLEAAEKEEEDLLMQEEECSAEVEFLDDELDAVVDEVVGITGNVRGTPLYKELFGSLQVSAFKRPTLNEQLSAMANWIEVLAGKSDPRLAKIRDRLEMLVPEAESAQAQQRAVATRLRVFRETGMRPQLIAEFNALRKSILGELSKLQHEHALGSGWAESFFRRSSHQPRTLRELERRIAATAETLAELEAARNAILAAQAAAEEAARAAEEQVKQAQIAEKREQLARLQAELAELEHDE